MVHVRVSTNKQVTEAQEEKIKNFFSMCMGFIPGKNEKMLFVEIDGGKNIYLGGDKTKESCFVEFEIFGTLDKGAAMKISGPIAKNIEEILGVSRMNIHVCFITTPLWSSGGMIN